MNILFITDRIPYPPHDGGSLRTFNLVKQLALRHEVTLVALTHLPAEDENIPAIQALGVQVVSMLRPTRPARTLWQRARLHFSPVPHFLAHRPLPEDFGERLAALRREQDFDVVHLDYALTAPCAAFVSDLPIVLTQHNVQSRIPYSYVMAHSSLRRLLLWREALNFLKWRRAEIAWSRLADVIVAVSQVEALYYRRRLPGIPVEVIPNGVGIGYFASVNRCPEPATLLFTGGMNWLPNVDAVRYFCREIYPHVKAQRPDVRLLIVGRDPAPEVQALASDPTVTVTGQVPDVRPYFGQATVFVVPLRAGGGTRLKILEAFAARVPVVSTPLGCDGLEVNDGSHLLVADSPQTFAQQTLRLLADADLRAWLTQAGYDLAKARYDYPVVVRGLEAALMLAIQRKRGTRDDRCG
ncbi:MAG: glycosyltransferase [Anaerolineae bacterium]|nr:glycosyltransferase [Anaerolineae bacterium]